jgi:multicomponent Na+:H+ antiporter subunit C
MAYLPYIVAAWLLFIGLYGIVTSRNLIHLIVCLMVVQSSTYVLLLSIGFRFGAIAPIFDQVAPGAAPAVDPVVKALTLTDIVVGDTVTALVLAMAVQVSKHRKTLDPRRLRPMKG